MSQFSTPRKPKKEVITSKEDWILPYKFQSFNPIDVISSRLEVPNYHFKNMCGIKKLSKLFYCKHRDKKKCFAKFSLQVELEEKKPTCWINVLLAHDHVCGMSWSELDKCLIYSLLNNNVLFSMVLTDSWDVIYSNIDSIIVPSHFKSPRETTVTYSSKTSQVVSDRFNKYGHKIRTYNMDEFLMETLKKETKKSLAQQTSTEHGRKVTAAVSKSKKTSKEELLASDTRDFSSDSLNTILKNESTSLNLNNVISNNSLNSVQLPRKRKSLHVDCIAKKLLAKQIEALMVEDNQSESSRSSNLSSKHDIPTAHDSADDDHFPGMLRETINGTFTNTNISKFFLA